MHPDQDVVPLPTTVKDCLEEATSAVHSGFDWKQPSAIRLYAGLKEVLAHASCLKARLI